MAQVSYSTITITDTTDIERIYVVYAKHTSNTSTTGLPSASTWTESIASAPGSGDYIWQRTVVKKSGTNELSYGNPVCVTGPEGDANDITAIEIQYGTSATWSTQPNSWSNDTPTYSSSTPNYWTRTRLKYEDNTYSSWVVNKDYALTETMEQSIEANEAVEALDAKLKYFFYPGDSNYPGVYAASGREGESPSVSFDTDSISTYGYNVALKPTGISIGYNTAKTIELDGSIPALKLYKPSKTSQGTLTAQLDANGLTLKDGGIVAGTLGQSGYIYLSTIDHPTGNSGITINGFEPQQGSGEHWRQVIGTKFGVTDAGTLYAYDAHIEGQITIGGGYDITEAIENTLTFDTSYTFDNLDPHQTVTFTAHIYRGGVDITSSFYDEDFTWFYKTENNSTALPINTNTNNQNNGKTITFNLSNIGYGCEIVGKFEPTSEANLLDSNSNNLTDTNNTSLTTQTTESGNSVRVRDLSYVTTLQQSDAIMAITSNSEKLITIANLANTLRTTSVQIVRW